jgi:hypothetical protein
MNKKTIHMAFNKILVVVFLVSALAFPIFNARVAFAAAPSSREAIKNGVFSWVDRNTIHANIDGTVYYFRATNVEGGGIGESAYLGYDEHNSDCWGRMRFDSNYPFEWVGADNSGGDDFRPGMTAPQNINVDMDWIDPNSSSSNCVGDSAGDYIKHVPLTHPNNFNVYFTVDGDGRGIHTVGDQDDRHYTQSGHAGWANLFTRDSEEGDSCQDVIVANKTNGTYKSYEMAKGGGGGDPPDAAHNTDNSCELIDGSGYVKMNVAQKLGNAGALKNDPNPNPGTDAAGDTSTSCDGEGLSLGWIICGMTEIVGNFGQTIFSSYIQPMMENTPLSVDPNDPFYKSWQGFRLLGNIMLIGSMLAIVYSQARGGGGGQ